MTYVLRQGEDNICCCTEYFAENKDGLHLYTRVSVPKSASKCPTVIRRTPYEAVPEEITKDSCDGLLRAGYAVITQHCRGRGGSEGECIPYLHEGDDSLDLIHWACTLPHFNGELYLLGGSYGATVWLMLPEFPQEVKSAILEIQTDRLYERHYVNGLARGFVGAEWQFGMMSRSHPRLPEVSNEQIYRRPYKDIVKRALGTHIPYFEQALLHNIQDEYWTGMSSHNIMEKIHCPVLLVDGWYDFYTHGMCSMWERMLPETREKSCFLMGPYGHGTRVQNSDMSLPHGDLPADYRLQWLEHIRTGKPYPYGNPGSFCYYSVGADKWKEKRLSSFPGKEIKIGQNYYFSSDKTLTCKPPSKAFLSWKYEPEQPCRCFSANRLCRAFPPNSTDNVLSFEGVPFKEESEFFGCVQFFLWVSSTAEDTSFYLRLYLVRSGEAYALGEIAGALLTLNSSAKPDNPSLIQMRTHPLAFTLLPGDSLRVDISSSASEFVPHSNIKGHWAEVESSKPCRNTIYFGESHMTLYPE